MTIKQSLFADHSINGMDYLVELLRSKDRVLVKKLSNNDRDWARFENKHQAGVYIPVEQRDGGFFPELSRKARPDPKDADIFEAYFRTSWPQTGDMDKRTRLVHYTSKGTETHMTGVPKAAFATLLPASYLVIGKSVSGEEQVYSCLTVDSASEEAELLRDTLELQPDFLIGEFNPIEKQEEEKEKLFDFAEQVILAWLAGNIETFAIANALMPNTSTLAALARAEYLKGSGQIDINPFRLDNPGDVLREISRSIEWNLFREFQRRERTVSLVRMIMGDSPKQITAKSVIRELVERFPEIDALMLSASQQRKSRAGYSYEHHIEAMLTEGGIPFEKQVVIEAKKRPDFILPSLAYLKKPINAEASGLILSAKTTLRERWKQVERELTSGALFLTTVDENIAGNSIEEMSSMNITLVVPEKLKHAKETEYKKHSNVMSFRQFCDEVIFSSLIHWP
ncbi:type II restriction endonuclease [Hoeflea sp. YIM 152468]|uniref:type II restriction endonuclease n=1 Tax=Hoeflea sp. YIM 152468 TaxID=3031759 RepID=UPI0023DBFD28|nr:type II restriction endonuclease [Hoeflea sp. YIM 152468]MDF1607801.1 type II restriction endonuclease [Hoeflea sp. YIM 152468]